MVIRQKNDYYSSIVGDFLSGKDSNMEMAKIIQYDSERLVAKVFTISSKQYKEDVPVFFPAMYLNTGIISPPVEGSTSLLFWGPDRQPFLLPIQLTIPNYTVQNGVSKINASPGFHNELLSLKNIQGGELLFRSLGGAYLFAKNLGDIELGTPRLHRFSISQKDGAADLHSERLRFDIANHRLYLGAASMDSNIDTRTHFYFDLEEQSSPTTLLTASDDDNTLLEKVLTDQLDTIALADNPKLLTYQMGHVFSEQGELEIDDFDGTELFSKKEITKGNVRRTHHISKGGREVIKTTDGSTETEVVISCKDVGISQQRLVDGVPKKTHIGIDSDGRIICGMDDKKYDLLHMLEWFYEQQIET